HVPALLLRARGAAPEPHQGGLTERRSVLVTVDGGRSGRQLLRRQQAADAGGDRGRVRVQGHRPVGASVSTASRSATNRHEVCPCIEVSSSPASLPAGRCCCTSS